MIARCDAGPNVRVDLRAIATRCEGANDECRAARLGVVAAALPVDLARVVPVPRPRAQVDGTLALIARVAADGRDVSPRAPVHLPLAADIEILYMFDGVDTMTALNAADLATLAIPADALHAATVTNCARYAGDVERTRDGSVEIWTGGIWLSGLVVDPAAWTREAQSGPLVIAVPARDTILVLHGGTLDDLAHLSSLARQLEADAQVPVSSALLSWTGSGWAEWSGG